MLNIHRLPLFFLSYLKTSQIMNISNGISLNEQNQILEAANRILDSDLNQIQNIALEDFRETKFYDNPDISRRLSDIDIQNSIVDDENKFESILRENMGQDFKKIFLIRKDIFNNELHMDTVEIVGDSDNHIVLDGSNAQSSPVPGKEFNEAAPQPIHLVRRRSRGKKKNTLLLPLGDNTETIESKPGILTERNNKHHPLSIDTTTKEVLQRKPVEKTTHLQFNRKPTAELPANRKIAGNNREGVDLVQVPESQFRKTTFIKRVDEPSRSHEYIIPKNISHKPDSAKKRKKLRSKKHTHKVRDMKKEHHLPHSDSESHISLVETTNSTTEENLPITMKRFQKSKLELAKLPVQKQETNSLTTEISPLTKVVFDQPRLVKKITVPNSHQESGETSDSDEVETDSKSRKKRKRRRQKNKKRNKKSKKHNKKIRARYYRR